MLYYPIITSGWKSGEYKQTVNRKLEGLYQDLKMLVYWEEQHKIEMCFHESNDKESEYRKLLGEVERLLDNKGENYGL